MSMSMSIAIFSVAQIAKLRVHESVYCENKNVIIKCGGRICGKEMS